MATAEYETECEAFLSTGPHVTAHIECPWRWPCSQHREDMGESVCKQGLGNHTT